MIPLLLLSLSSPVSAEPVAALEVPTALLFHWDKRPHRLSAMELRPPGTLSPEDPGALHLGGGTWANGEAASDQARGEVALHTLRAEGLRQRTVRLALGPSVARGVGLSTMSAAQELEAAGSLWIQGWSLQLTGPHASTGATLSGLHLGLEPRDGGYELRAEVDFGEVPDRRQVLEGVLAEWVVWLGELAQPPGEAERLVLDGHQPRRRFRREVPVGQGCWPGAEELRLMQSLNLEIKPEGDHPGRYLRAFGYDLLGRAALFSNFGPVTRETDWRFTLGSVAAPGGLDAGRRYCWSG